MFMHKYKRIRILLHDAIGNLCITKRCKTVVRRKLSPCFRLQDSQGLKEEKAVAFGLLLPNCSVSYSVASGDLGLSLLLE